MSCCCRLPRVSKYEIAIHVASMCLLSHRYGIYKFLAVELPMSVNTSWDYHSAVKTLTFPSFTLKR
jgi:hypothetical protein